MLSWNAIKDVILWFLFWPIRLYFEAIGDFVTMSDAETIGFIVILAANTTWILFVVLFWKREKV